MINFRVRWFLNHLVTSRGFMTKQKSPYDGLTTCPDFVPFKWSKHHVQSSFCTYLYVLVCIISPFTIEMQQL
jgi:hypothetical protein